MQQPNSLTPERAVTVFNETFVLARICSECKTKRYIKVHSPRSLCVLCHSREVCLITRSETRAKVGQILLRFLDILQQYECFLRRRSLFYLHLSNFHLKIFPFINE